MRYLGLVVGRQGGAGGVSTRALSRVLDRPIRYRCLRTSLLLVRHRWAAGLWLRQMPGPARVAHMEQYPAALAASDMTPSVAHVAFHAVNNHVIGYTLQG